MGLRSIGGGGFGGVLAAASVCLAAGVNPPTAIPRLKGVTIDGDPGDWLDSGYRVELMLGRDTGTRPARDFDPRFRVGWDERGLLLLAVVRDDTVVVADAPERLYAKDSIEIFVSDAPGSQDGYQVCVAPAGGTAQSRPRHGFLDHRRGGARGAPRAIYAGSTFREGYILEVLLPWANLGRTAAQPGDELGFQFCVNDADAEDMPDEWFRVFWYRSWESHVDPRALGLLRLSDEPGARVGALAELERFGAAGLARFSVIGLPSYNHWRAELRAGRRVVARSMLALTERWAEVRFYMPEKDLPPERLEAVIGEDEVVPLTVYERPGKVGLKFNAPLAVPEDTGVPLALLPDPVADLRAEARARVTLLDEKGRAVFSAEPDLGEVVTCRMPKGIYSIQARVPDFHGAALEGESGCIVHNEPVRALRDLLESARERAASRKVEAYAGWLLYLCQQLEDGIPDGEWAPTRQAVLAGADLTRWMGRVHSRPDLAGLLAGTAEWAYRSAVDGTGQPFRINVPAGLDAAAPVPLFVWLHGRGRDHAADAPRTDALELHVLGRARAGGYAGLSEVDVLEAIDYVCRHWPVDPDRIHLAGESMGGYGVYRLASRFPDRFASALVYAGSGTGAMLDNARDVPVYALHGRDDGLEPPAGAQATVRRLREAGGAAILREAADVGHDVGGFAEGVESARAWEAGQVRRAGREQRHVRFAALDGLARRAWWAGVTEWGPAGRPASVDARLAADNTLYLAFDNVRAAEFDLAGSPADGARPLRVVLDNTVLATLPAPLADRIHVRGGAEGWRVSAEAPKPGRRRLHYPGGAAALFHGEPLLVVWGTQADAGVNARLRAAGEAARRSTGPGWAADPDLRMETGALPGKPDTEVTDDDMERHNLLLIGTPAQNSVVARLAPGLPVSLGDGRVATGDGAAWSFAGRALGLLHYNPRAPWRLIYWVASDDPAFYAPGAALMGWQQWETAPPDFVLGAATAGTQVAARRFDSDWEWEPGYAASPRLREGVCWPEGWSRVIGQALRESAGAPFALVETALRAGEPVWAAGETRTMDVLAWQYCTAVTAVDLSGDELRRLLDAAAGQATGFVCVPGDAAWEAAAEQDYAVALSPAWAHASLARVLRKPARNYRITGYDLKGALARHLSAVAGYRQE